MPLRPAYTTDQFALFRCQLVLSHAKLHLPQVNFPFPMVNFLFQEADTHPLIINFQRPTYSLHALQRPSNGPTHAH